MSKESALQEHLDSLVPRENKFWAEFDFKAGYTARDNETCTWVKMEGGFYQSSRPCSTMIPLSEMRPSTRYCPYCGRKIVEDKDE